MLEPSGPEQPKLFKPEETHSETGGEKTSLKPAPDGSAVLQRPFENDSPGEVHRDLDKLRGQRIRENLRRAAGTTPDPRKKVR